MECFYWLRINIFSGSTRLLWLRVSLQSVMLCKHECHFVSGISQSNFCIFHNTTESVIIPPLETNFFKKKNPCHHVALLKDNAVLNVSFQFGTILLCVSFTYQIPISAHLILLNLVLKLSNKVFLKKAKPFAEFTLLFATSVTMLARTPQILHHMHWPSFPLGSKYNQVQIVY